MGLKNIFLILLLSTSGLFIAIAENGSPTDLNFFEETIDDLAQNKQEPIAEQSMQSNIDQKQNVNSYEEHKEDYTNFSPTEYVKSEATSIAIETSSIASELHSPGRDSYIVDFGFHQLFTFTKSQVIKDGWIGYLAFSETVFFSVDLTIPVNLTLNYNPDVEAGHTANVIVDLYKDPTGASLSIDYGFILGGQYRKGPWGSKTSFQLLNYTNTYLLAAFEVPLDPVPLTEIPVPLPLDLLLPGISALFAIDLLLTPQLDVDVSADLFFDGLGGPNLNSLTFNTEERQSFAIEVDSFSPSETGVLFGLTNFSMDFFLSLLWSLQVRFAGLLSFLNFFGPLKIKLFTYPRLPLAGLLTEGAATGVLNVQPTQNLPEFSLDTYQLFDGDNDVLEPGDSVSLNTDFVNVGSGPALNANVTVSSNNVTLNSGVTGQYLFPILDNGLLNHGISFDLAGGYTERNVNITFDVRWLAANGSMRNSIEVLTIPVLQSGDAFLMIDNWAIYDGDDGIWDADEGVRIDLDISKVGTGIVDFAYIEVYATGPGGFSSNNTWDSFTGTLTTWNSSAIYLTSPIDISVYEVDVYIWVSYDINAGPTHDDFQVLSFDIFPLSPMEDLAGIYGSLNTGIDDGVFQAGETFDVTADLENLGNYDSGVIYGLLISDDSDVLFDDTILTWSNQVPLSGPISSTNSILMQISPNADNQTIQMTLYILYNTWWGEEIINKFPVTLTIVQQPDPILDLNYYNVLDINSGTFSSLTPGELSLIVVNIDVTSGPAFDAIGTLTSDNDEILILNDTSYYGDLAIGDNLDGDGFVVYIPANFVGGDVTFYVNVTLYSATGETVQQLGVFTITVAAGDTVLPQFTLNAPVELKQGESGVITITASDDIGVDSIYFAYYNYSTDDWEFIETTWDTTPTVTLNIVMGSTEFLYAFLIFDVSGNLAGGGLDIPLMIGIPEPVVSSSSTSFTSSTSSQTSDPTTTKQPSTTISSSKKSEGDSAPISIIPMIIGLFTIGLSISVKRKKNK